MTRIQITRSFIFRPGQFVAPGDVVEANKRETLEILELDRGIVLSSDEPAVQKMAPHEKPYTDMLLKPVRALAKGAKR